MKEYLVPRAVRARLELLPGLGFAEVLAIAGGAALGAGPAFLLLHLSLSPAGRLLAPLFAFALPPAAAYLLVKPDVTGVAPWTQLQAGFAAQRRPSRYFYRR